MPAEPFRFVQAADLHLEQPLYGLAEAPDHLRALLIDAPFTAAERVFDAALAESADFLILAGDVLNVRLAGPRAIAFLLDQFERLAARDISVYWAGGTEDPPEQWPTSAKLPPNVHQFSRDEVEDLTHYRHEEPLCRVSGISRFEAEPIHPEQFEPDRNGLYSIAVAHGLIEAEALAHQPIDYWALGGSHQRQSLFTTPHTAHFAGTPQGRSPAETGPHGCTLVNVDGERKVRTQLIVTDAVRWRPEQVTISDDMSRDDLRRVLGERTQKLAAEAADRGLLVDWTIEAAGALGESARLGWLSRRAAWAGELLQELRDEFSRRTPSVWAVSLAFHTPTTFSPAWCEEDTILGDFLRAVQVHQADDLQPLNVSAYLSERQRESTLAAALQITAHETRQRVLREAAALGVDLLRGETISATPAR